MSMVEQAEGSGTREPKQGRLDWCALGGLAFVALIVITFAFNNQLDSHRSRAEFAAYYTDFRGSSHEWRELLATFVATLAAFSFVWFLLRLYRLVRAVDSGLAAITLGGGLLALTLLLAALVASTAVGTSLAYSDDYKVDLDTAILMSDVALFLNTASGVGLATLLTATSLAARRGALLPRWLVWYGFAVALAGLLIVALDGVPLALFLIWVALASAVFLRRTWTTGA